MEFQYDLDVNARTGTFGYLPAGEPGYRDGKFYFLEVSVQTPLKKGDKVFLEPNAHNGIINQRYLGKVARIELIEDPQFPGGRLVVAHLKYFLWSSFSADLNFFLLDRLEHRLRSVKEGTLEGLTTSMLAPVSVEKA